MYLILGLARSGCSVATYLKKNNKYFCVYDDRQDKTLAHQNGWTWFDDAVMSLSDVTMIITSPGIPYDYPSPHPLIQYAKEKGIPLHTACSFFKLHHPKPFYIGITGTNGKSTTTSLVHHILKTNAYNVAMGGNIGIPLFDVDKSADYMVVELSSFELERSPDFNLDIAVWTNFTEDHIAQHGTLDDYYAAKKKVFNGSKKQIISIDDALSEKITKNYPDAVAVSAHNELPFLMTNLNLEGAHNIQNALCAYRVCEAVGLSHDNIQNGIDSFPGLKHRQQIIYHHDRMIIVNDSKATSAAATEVALRRFSNIYWIVGGKDKSDGITPLVPYFHKVKKAYTFGHARHRFGDDLTQHHVSFDRFETMEDAFKNAYNDAITAEERAVILLSPACASFDQYKDFEDRGDAFIACIKQLTT